MWQENHTFSKDQLEEIINEFGTPFHIYVEQDIRENARKLNRLFPGLPSLKSILQLKPHPTRIL